MRIIILLSLVLSLGLAACQEEELDYPRNCDFIGSGMVACKNAKVVYEVTEYGFKGLIYLGAAKAAENGCISFGRGEVENIRMRARVHNEKIKVDGIKYDPKIIRADITDMSGEKYFDYYLPSFNTTCGIFW